MRTRRTNTSITCLLYTSVPRLNGRNNGLLELIRSQNRVLDRNVGILLHKFLVESLPALLRTVTPVDDL